MKKLLTFLLTCAAALLTAGPLTITTDKPEGVYTDADKEIVFKVSPLPGEDEEIVCRLQINRQNGTKVEMAADGTVKVPVTTGWIRLDAVRVNKKGKTTGKAMKGALCNVPEIKAGAVEPEDFDAFWAAEIAKMNKVPMNPVFEEVTGTPENQNGAIRIWKFKLDCGEGNFAMGYLAMPANAKPGTLPAIAQFRGAGTYTLQKAPVYYAKNGIHVMMSPHMTEGGKGAAYDKAMRKALNGYMRRDADNRDKYYMKRMILRAVRTMQFIKTLPEWDKKTLVTHGESQGGFQSLVAAVLTPETTFCLAMVPALSDHQGYRIGYPNGWPNLIAVHPGIKKPTQKLYQAIDAAAPYFDCVNFARRAHCKTWISTGLQDNVCPPTGVCAVYNVLPVEKQLYIAPHRGHNAGYPAAGPVLDEMLNIKGK